jgi:hypothetical protein
MPVFLALSVMSIRSLGATNNLDRVVSVASVRTDFHQRCILARNELLLVAFLIRFLPSSRRRVRPALWDHNGQAGRNGIALLAVSLPACVGLALTAEYVSASLVGPAFRTGVAELIPIMSFAALARGIRSHFIDHAFHLSGRPLMMLWTYVPVTVINIALNAYVIPRYGMFGAAWTAFACQVLTVVGGWFLGTSLFPVWLPIGQVVRCVAAVVPMVVGMTLIRFPLDWFGLSASVLLGGVCCTLPVRYCWMWGRCGRWGSTCCAGGSGPGFRLSPIRPGDFRDSSRGPRTARCLGQAEPAVCRKLGRRSGSGREPPILWGSLRRQCDYFIAVCGQHMNKKQQMRWNRATVQPLP